MRSQRPHLPCRLSVWLALTACTKTKEELAYESKRNQIMVSTLLSNNVCGTCQRGEFEGRKLNGIFLALGWPGLGIQADCSCDFDRGVFVLVSSGALMHT